MFLFEGKLKTKFIHKFLMHELFIIEWW